MKEVLRIDRLPLGKPTTTPQGFIKYGGVVARAGIYEYRIDGKLTRELRPHEELQSPETLASYEAAPITIEHPPEENGVTADNVRKYEVGSVSGVARADGDYVVSDAIVIKDARALKLVKGGKQELSPGTKCLLDETPGSDARYGYPGNPTGRYDAVQRRIRVNHLAICDFARGGSAIRLRTDSVEVVRNDNDGKLTTVTAGHQHLISLCSWDHQPLYSGCTSHAMSEGSDVGHDHPWTRGTDGKITIGESAGHTHAILDGDASTSVAHLAELAAASAARGDSQIDRSGPRREPGSMDKDEQIRSLKEQLATATTKLATITETATSSATRADSSIAKADTLQAEVDRLNAQIAAAATELETAAIVREKMRADSAEHALRERNDSFDAVVEARVALERRAAVVMPELNMRGMSERAIVSTVVKRLDAKQDIGTAVTDGYLRGRFDSLFELHERNARSLQRVGEVATHHQTERTDALDEKRRALRNQGTEPLPNSREAQAAAAARGRA